MPSGRLSPAQVMVAMGAILPFAPALYSVTASLPKLVTKVIPLAFTAKLIGVLNCVFEPEMLIAGAAFP
jgi:hypothetical protein